MAVLSAPVALSAPHLPPHPGASTLHSLTPASTTDPEATSPAGHLRRPALPLPPAPGATPCPSHEGRSKAQRWSDDGSPVSSTGAVSANAGQSASYKEVLVSIKAPVQVPVEATAAADGWVTVEDRRARHKCPRRPRPPPKPVLADLRDKCFNCFSPLHRAAE